MNNLTYVAKVVKADIDTDFNNDVELTWELLIVSANLDMNGRVLHHRCSTNIDNAFYQAADPILATCGKPLGSDDFEGKYLYVELHDNEISRFYSIAQYMVEKL